MPSSGYTAISFTAGEQPTTAKWNLVGSNDASFNTGNGFNDGILAQRHFGTNSVPAVALDTAAITLGYAQITSSLTTTNIALTYATGLTCTVTVPAGGRRVKVTVYSAQMSSDNNGLPVVCLFTGASAGALTTQLQQWNGIGAFESGPGMALTWVGTPSAGTVTYNVGFSNHGGNTTSIIATSTLPAFILVEAI